MNERACLEQLQTYYCLIDPLKVGFGEISACSEIASKSKEWAKSLAPGKKVSERTIYWGEVGVNRIEGRSSMGEKIF